MIIKNYKELLSKRKGSKEAIRKAILDSIEISLKAIDPIFLINKNVKIESDTLKICGNLWSVKNVNDIFVIGGGKASGSMAQELERILESKIKGGLIMVLEGTKSSIKTRKIEICEGTHPIPSDSNVTGTKKILKLVQNAGKNDLIISLISGGGSALLNLPPGSVPLKDIQEFYTSLIQQDLDIVKINTLRKHLSQIKGGQLAKRCHPVPMINLIISDVLNDPLEVIASGPTVPDSTTFEECQQIIQSRNMTNVPTSISEHIQKGINQEIPETPKADDKCFSTVKNFIIGNLKFACNAIQSQLAKQGLKSEIKSLSVHGNVKNLSNFFVDMATKDLKREKTFETPRVFIFGGESTVDLANSSGKGGRNQELCLHVLKLIQQNPVSISFCSLGTDGIDGNSDAAGAIIDLQTVQDAQDQAIQIEPYLENHDSNNFFKKLKDGVIMTGPTGTNVADIILMVI